MQPILFLLNRIHLNTDSKLRKGVPPPIRGMIPLPTASWLLSGVTRDAAGVAEGGFTVYLFDMADGTPRLVQTTVSDAGGNYSFSVGLGIRYWAVDYKSGTPDKTGASLNTLVGV